MPLGAPPPAPAALHSPYFPSHRAAVGHLGPATWQLLLLLGFDADDYCRRENIKPGAGLLGPRMFASASPNTSGMNCVLHFLLTQLGGDTADRINTVFPTYDPAGKRQFRSVAQAVIKKLCADNVLPRECGTRATSVLNVPNGHRAYLLVAHLALAAALHTLRSRHAAVYDLQPSAVDEQGVGAPTSATRSELLTAVADMQRRAHAQAARFKQRSSDILRVQDHWQTTAADLVRQFELASIDLSKLEKRAAAAVPMSADGVEVLEARKQQALTSWQALDDFLAHPTVVKAIRTVEDFVERRKHPSSHRLDVAPLRAALASSTVTSRLVHAASPPAAGGASSDPSSVNLWAVVESFHKCLTDVVRHLSDDDADARAVSPLRHGPAAAAAPHASTDPLWRLAQHVPRLRKAVSEQSQNLANVRALAAHLRSSIESLQGSVQDVLHQAQQQQQQQRQQQSRRAHPSAAASPAVLRLTSGRSLHSPGTAGTSSPQLIPATPMFTYVPQHFSSPAALAAAATPSVGNPTPRVRASSRASALPLARVPEHELARNRPSTVAAAQASRLPRRVHPAPGPDADTSAHPLPRAVVPQPALPLRPPTALPVPTAIPAFSSSRSPVAAASLMDVPVFQPRAGASAAVPPHPAPASPPVARLLFPESGSTSSRTRTPHQSPARAEPSVKVIKLATPSRKRK